MWGDYDDSSSYQLLLRVLKEQAVQKEDGTYRLRTKEDGGMDASILRRKYGIDKIPVRGLIRSRLFFGCKIGALNIKKFCRYMQDQDKCALKMAVA